MRAQGERIHAAPAPEEGRAGAEVRPRAQPGQYLTFFLAGEEYGAGILQIREIIQYDTLTAIPSTPAWIRGVLNLRGGVVPVIDLAVKFGLPGTTVSTRSCVVIVEIAIEGRTSVMGIAVDAVGQVVELARKEIEPPPAFGTEVQIDYLLGMGRLEQRLVLLLDLDRLLSSDELTTAAGSAAALRKRYTDDEERPMATS